MGVGTVLKTPLTRLCVGLETAPLPPFKRYQRVRMNIRFSQKSPLPLFKRYQWLRRWTPKTPLFFFEGGKRGILCKNNWIASD